MAVYLKKFDNHSQYVAFTGTTDFVLPNVSYCVAQNEVHYNAETPTPVETILPTKFNAKSTSSPTRIANATTGFSSVEIDGVEQQSVTTGYTFDTTGEHDVNYSLTDPTSIGNNAFNGCEDLASVDIPVEVTSIGNGTFEGCSGLDEMGIPSGVTSIGSQTFSGCSGLNSVTVEAETPPSLADSNAFDDTNDCPIYVPSGSVDAYKEASNWSDLEDRIEEIPTIETRVVAKFNVTDTSNPTKIANEDELFDIIEIDGVELPSVVSAYTFSTTGEHTVKYTLTDPTSIDDYTFDGCVNITNVIIPDGVTSIGEGTFYNCSGLTSVTIPDSVTSFGYGYTFANCSNLTNIVIPNGITILDDGIFENCSKLKRLNSDTDGVFNIPNNVTRIGERVFEGCTRLKSITIPSGVTSIGDGVFYDCSSITSITCYRVASPTIISTTFENIKECGVLFVPQGDTGYDTWMRHNSGYLGGYSWIKLNIGTDISMIGTFNVTSTSNPTKIINRTNVFSEVEIDGVVQQNVATGYTFSTTGNHTVKYKLSSPTLLDEEAFADCSRLTNCVISVAVLYIEDSVFYNCSSMSSCTIGENVVSIGNDAFYNCSSLTGITIPDSVESTGLEAFDGCINLTSIAIGSGLRSNLDVLIDCDSLSSITVSSNNSKYDSRNNCNAIIETSTNTLVQGCKNTVIPNTVTSIGSSAFAFCNGLTSIDIPNSVTSIGEYVFSNCSGLTSINIPSGVTNIGSGVCSGCSSLSSIISNAATAPTISSYTFRYIKTGGTLYVPQGSTGYDVWMQNANYYLGKYNWTIVQLVETRVVAKFNVTSTSSPTRILSSRTNIDSVYIDDVEQQSVPTGYTFTTPGEHIVKYVLEDTTIINEGTFSNCNRLTSVNIPSGITSIDRLAFSECGNLVRLNSNTDGLFNIPSGVTSIGSGAFEECNSLTSVTIPDSVTSIGDGAFEYCSNLVSIVIPSGVTSIGDECFYESDSFIRLIMESTTPPTVGDDIFSTNLDIMKIYVPAESVDRYKRAWSDYASYIEAMPPFTDTRVVVKLNVTSTSNPTKILTSASSFKKIEIDGVTQQSVTTGYTFSTTGEHTVKYTLKNLTMIGEYSFQNCSNFTSVSIPTTVKDIDIFAFYGCGNITSLYLPNSVTSIDEQAFEKCSGLTSLNLNAKLIGYGAFSDCTSLTSITISSGVTNIYDSVFSGCTSLSSVTIPNNVKTIGSAFEKCYSLTSATIENGVITIDGTFYDCSGLTRINSNVNGVFNIPNTVTIIDNGAFYNCINLTSINIPSGVTSIGHHAFQDCRSLTSIDIPSGVTSIGQDAFWGCWGLTSINIPNSVTNVGKEAFMDCKSLSSCTIGSGVTSINEFTFYGCNFSSITIPDSVTSISNSVFTNCSNLTNVTIGSGVTSISGYAFNNCSKLTSITSNAMTAPTVQTNTFRNIKTGGTLTVPQNSTGYDTWMQNANYYLGLYNWTKVEV